MSAEQFLDRLEEQGLLDHKIISELRAQVARKPKKVTAQAIAKLLVDNGHLTRFQASKLVGDANPAGGGRDTVTSTSTAVEEEDLGLAPDDEDDGDGRAAGKSGQKQPAQPVAEEDDDEIVELEAAAPEPAPALQSGAGREPLAGAGLTPAGGAGLEPLGGGLEPVDAGLQPLDAGLQPLDAGLQPLGGGGLQPLDSLGGAPAGGHPSLHAAAADPFAAGAAPEATAAAPNAQRTKWKAPAEPRNVWDSKLLLIGGAVLMLLVAAFVVLYFAVFYGSAQEAYDMAAEDYRQGSYTQAIKKFELFEKHYPSNPLVKSAQIKIGMARLWQAVEGSSDPERALRTAQDVLPQISEIDPTLFEVEARDELAGLLPEIAERFSTKAVSAAERAEAQKLVDLTKEAMALVDNPMYVPGGRRRTLEARINGIMENVERVEQGIRQDQRREEVVGEIEQLVSAGSTNEAYEAYRQVLRQFPGLDGNADLKKAVLSITERVRELVRVDATTLAATTEDVARPPTRSVVLANRQGTQIAGAEGQVIYVLARGAAYGLDAASGQVLWRRFVGYETTYHPRPLSEQPGADCLLVDHRRQELARIEARTGKPVWRLAIGQPFLDPLITAERIYVADQQGRILEIDPASGNSPRQVQLPQPVAVSPTTDGKRPQLYQVGEHSNLYAISTDTLEANEVLFLGHLAGGISVPPVMALGYLFVVENVGASDSRVHILSTNASGLEVRPAQDPIRLSGNMLLPPLVLGRRVLLVTDRGEIRVLDVDPNAEPPVSNVASTRGTASESMIGYPVVSSGNLWIGDRRLSKYEIQTSRGQLARQWVKDDGDTFVAPLQLFGNAVVSVLRRQGATGTTVAARHTESGNLIWQTDLAVEAAQIITDRDSPKTVAVSAEGALFEINAASVQQGYNDQPTENVGESTRGASFTQAVDMGDGRFVFASPQDARRAVVYDPTRNTGRLGVVNLKVPSAQIRNTSHPQAFAGGLLVPLSDGRVVNLDLVTGDDHLLPFQPDLKPGTQVHWWRPALLGDGSREFVIADNRRNLFRVGIGQQPRPHLEAKTSVKLEMDLVAPLAATPDAVLGVARTGATDTVVAFAPGDLKLVKEFPMQGRVTWGPYRVGDVVFLTSDADGLSCYEAGPQLRWKSPLPHGALAGPPVVDGNRYLLASQDGHIWRLDAQSGEVVGTPYELGEPLGAQPVIFPQGLLLTGSDGAVHLVTKID